MVKNVVNAPLKGLEANALTPTVAGCESKMKLEIPGITAIHLSKEELAGMTVVFVHSPNGLREIDTLEFRHDASSGWGSLQDSVY